MDFNHILDDALKSYTLLEASLQRIWQHHQNREFAIISAWRATNNPDDNHRNTRILKSKLRTLSYGYIPIEGVGQERNEAGTIVQSVEPSFMIINEPSRQEFRSDILRLAREFDQDFVLFWRPGDGEIYDVKNDVVDTHLSRFVPLAAEFYSQHRGRAFHVEGVKYGNPPKNWIHGMGEQAMGGIMFEYRETEADWRKAMAKEN